MNWKKFNPIWWFMNDKDPHPPDKYKPDSLRWWRYLCWYWRNPLHNFFWYVVGIHDHIDQEVIIWRFNNVLFSPIGGWNWSVIRSGKWGYYPFISYCKGSFEFYIGWRPRKGDFGISTRKKEE